MLAKSAQSCFDQVLVHLPQYGVIVCKACRFAVQPKALPSHLLRHQIYRNERRQLLQYCSKLDLLEPDDVVNPAANANPLPHLSVQRGYRCEADHCDHACVSSKRMSQHWSESHNEPDSKNVRARVVYLQTFFRGNKIRYFEVNGPGNGQLEGLSHEKKGRHNTRAEHTDEHRASASPAATAAVASSSSTTSWEFTGHEQSPPPDDMENIIPLDLDTLQYFHHYMGHTCLTLRRGESESPLFWRRDIVHAAFKYPFLMHGILGVTAAHLTILNVDNPALLQKHHQASLRYQQAALVDFRSAMREPDTQNSTALIAFGRVVGVQTSVQHQLMHTYPHLASPGTAPDLMDNNHHSIARVMEVFHLLRGVGEMLHSFQPLLPHGSDFLLSEEVLEGLRDPTPARGQSSSPYHYDDPSGVSSSSPNSSSMMLDDPHHHHHHHSPRVRFGSVGLDDVSMIPAPALTALISLREQLSQRLDPQDPSTRELEAAVDALMVAYARSYASPDGPPAAAATASSSSSTPAQPPPPPPPPSTCDPPSPEPNAVATADHNWARWNGAEGWLTRTSERYVRMLAAAHPAALVVFAYWCPLLRRLEQDYWFVRGQSEWLIGIVLAHLPSEDWKAMVRGLM